MNTESIVLENQCLRAVVMPSFGGKIASLMYTQNQFELLFQNPKPEFTHAPLYADFSKFEACGFDDAFPCIDGEEVDIGGKKVRYPDHGEIWTASFDYSLKDEKLFLSYRSKILDYEYSKTVYLSGNSLVCEYKIKNIGGISFPCIWTAHCLARYEPDMRFLYPAETKAVEMAFDSPAPETAGKKYHFPHDVVDGENIDFTGLPKTEKGYARKYYIADQIREGYCGYEYPSRNMRAELFFDPALLPYLGLWITSGGFRGDYNCAFEPSSGYYDRISRAGANKRLDYLDPGETRTFSLTIKLNIRLTNQKENH
jgi:galactose mutarotase-like enzyme